MTDWDSGGKIKASLGEIVELKLGTYSMEDGTKDISRLCVIRVIKLVAILMIFLKRCQVVIPYIVTR